MLSYLFEVEYDYISVRLTYTLAIIFFFLKSLPHRPSRDYEHILKQGAPHPLDYQGKSTGKKLLSILGRVAGVTILQISPEEDKKAVGRVRPFPLRLHDSH